MLINGSPRHKGNNGEILDVFERAFRNNDVILHRIEPGLHKINPCIHCRSCEREKGCSIKDDMQRAYKEFDRSDIIVVSSPLYFNGITAQLKAIVDRCQAIWASKYVLKDPLINRNKKRKGLFICTAGQDQGNPDFSGALKVIEIFFRAVNVNEWNNFLISGVDTRPVWEREKLLQDIYHMANELSSFN